MSRLKKINQQRREKIKSTIIGLTLSILIGATGAVGSYALFVDNHSAETDIEVTMGSLDIGIDRQSIKKEYKKSPIEFTEKVTITLPWGSTYEEDVDYLKYESETFYEEFKISNTGSLDQLVNLELINTTSSPNELIYLATGVKYSLHILDDEDNIKETIIDDRSLIGSKNSEELKTIEISKGSSIKCKAEIYLPEARAIKGFPITFPKQDITFRLRAEAVQTPKYNDKEELNNEIYK